MGILKILEAFEVLPRNKREAAARFLAELSTNEDLRSAVLSGGDPYMERYRDAYQRMFDVSPPRETYQPDRETRKDLFGSDLAVNMQRTSLPPTPEELAKRKSLLEAMGLIEGLKTKRGQVAGAESPEEKSWWSEAMKVPTPYPAKKEMADTAAADETGRKLAQARTVRDELFPTDTDITMGDILGGKFTSPGQETTREIEGWQRKARAAGVKLRDALGIKPEKGKETRKKGPVTVAKDAGLWDPDEKKWIKEPATDTKKSPTLSNQVSAMRELTYQVDRVNSLLKEGKRPEAEMLLLNVNQLLVGLGRPPLKIEGNLVEKPFWFDENTLRLAPSTSMTEPDPGFAYYESLRMKGMSAKEAQDAYNRVFGGK